MHNIEYFSYEENIKRDLVQQKLDHYVAQEDWKEGCKGLARPNSLLDAIKRAKEAAGKADKAVAEYIKKHGTKKVSWLVKIEYHT